MNKSYKNRRRYLWSFLVLPAMLLMLLMPVSAVKAAGAEEGTPEEVVLQDVNINISSYSIEPSTVTAGGSFKLSFTVQRDGSQNIKDGSAYVSFQCPEGISYSGSSQKMKLSSFSNSQASTYTADFETAAELTGGKKTIGMVFSYVYLDKNTQMQGTNEGMVHVSVQAAKAPKLKIAGLSSELKIDAGKTASLGFSFTNGSSALDIKNLDIECSASDGLSLSGSGSISIGNIAAGASEKKSLKMQALKTAEGKQSVTFTYSYDYVVGSQTLNATGEKTITVTVNKSGAAVPGQPYVIMDKYNYGGAKSAGTSFTLLARFKNTSSTSTLKNIVITVETGDGLMLADASNKIMLKSLLPGKSVTKRIRLRVDAHAQTGYKPVNFKLNYAYASGDEVKEAETTASANISVTGKKESLSPATPNIMISSYDYGKKVAAGSQFKLHMTVKNTSTSKGIENMVVSMEMPEDLTIADSSNTFYVRSLSAGASYDYDIRLQALTTAKAMSSAITLNFTYEYVDGKERKQVTSTEQLSIPIYQPDRLSADLATQESEIYAGSEAIINIAYVNKGKGTLYNVESSIETDAEVLEPKQNLGNFEAGANGSIEFYVTPAEAGTLEGTVTINYEDENMKNKSIEIPFSYDVLDSEEMMGEEGFEEFPEDEIVDEEVLEENKSNKKLLKIALIVFLVIVVVIVIIVIVRKIRKKRKLRIQQLEDMVDDEE